MRGSGFTATKFWFWGWGNGLRETGCGRYALRKWPRKAACARRIAASRLCKTRYGRVDSVTLDLRNGPRKIESTQWIVQDWLWND